MEFTERLFDTGVVTLNYAEGPEARDGLWGFWGVLRGDDGRFTNLGKVGDGEGESELTAEAA